MRMLQYPKSTLHIEEVSSIDSNYNLKKEQVFQATSFSELSSARYEITQDLPASSTFY